MDSVRRGQPLRALELYCGIGGCAAALGSAASVAAAVDISQQALQVYRRNFPHPTATATIESLSAAALRAWQVDLWWMSPPCQPFTRRGLRRDAKDSRTQSFLELIDRLKQVRPKYIGIENVPGFHGSLTHTILRDALDSLSYHVQEHELCPTILGIPNRRPRFYLVAGRRNLRSLTTPALRRQPLREFLDPRPTHDLWVDENLEQQYPHALDVVDPRDNDAVAACFTSAYGRSPVRSGSYVRTPTGLRRFSPSEVLRLLGFPASYTLPADLPLHNAWRLAGNSLSVPAVRHVLSVIPELVPLRHLIRQIGGKHRGTDHRR